jgi:L-ascorbate metabolism protein UlaG (beta-lactamase superfamily)
MKIKHYLYNTFTIENGNTKIAIDPGCHVKLFDMSSLIPKAEWEGLNPDVLMLPIGEIRYSL